MKNDITSRDEKFYFLIFVSDYIRRKEIKTDSSPQKNSADAIEYILRLKNALENRLGIVDICSRLH